MACFFAKTRRLAFLAGVNLGFRVGLCDFRLEFFAEMSTDCTPVDVRVGDI